MKLSISVQHDPKGYLKIEIQDNGIGRLKAAEIKARKLHKKKSIGLQLTEKRLFNFSKDFKNDYSIEFVDLYDDEQSSKGTLVIIKIPMQ